jgi:hypothetical protein
MERHLAADVALAEAYAAAGERRLTVHPRAAGEDDVAELLAVVDEALRAFPAPSGTRSRRLAQPQGGPAGSSVRRRP